MSSKPLDAPDGPGWWAFEGKNAFNRQVQTVLQFTEWREPLIDDDGVEIEVYRIAEDRYPTIYNADHFRQGYNGKWYRVHMPWESPPEQPPAPTGQPHINVPWHPVEAIAWGEMSLHADDLAVTIGTGDTALATFAWPQEGEYAVCKRMDAQQPAMPQADWYIVPDGNLCEWAELDNRTIFVKCSIHSGIKHGYTLADDEYLVRRRPSAPQPHKQARPGQEDGNDGANQS